MATEPHWQKTATGYVLGDNSLTRAGSRWTLTTPAGSHDLGKRASFDHAERIIAAEASS